MVYFCPIEAFQLTVTLWMVDVREQVVRIEYFGDVWSAFRNGLATVFGDWMK